MGVEYASGKGFGIAAPNNEVNDTKVKDMLKHLFPDQVDHEETAETNIYELYPELLDMGIQAEVEGNGWSGETYFLFLVEGTRTSWGQNETYVVAHNAYALTDDQHDKFKEILELLDNFNVDYDMMGWIHYKSAF